MFRIDRSESNPNRISIFTGETCNLACTLCAPDASSRWQDELKQYPEPHPDALSNSDTDTVDFTNAVSITFGGGEPVLNKSTLPLLKLVDSNTMVLMHFNCTVLPSQKLLDECARFSNIEFILSIDDTEERFELLRYPAKWNKAVDNVKWMVEHCPPNIKFSVNTVISKLNEHTYHNVEAWAEATIPKDRLHYCSTNESNGVLNRYSKTNTFNHVNEAKWLDKLDQRRNTNWRQVFPLATIS
jgi:MoaA/NifB/PqqE/SkfB family radical SAM enzyme